MLPRRSNKKKSRVATIIGIPCKLHSMATEKRKASAVDRPAKKIKFDNHGQAKAVPSDKSRPSTNSTAKNNEPESEPRKSVKASLLSGEDRAFPRGGATVLTPLEQRQIRVEAERDVLFEEAGKTKVSKEEYDGSDQETAVKSKTKGKPAAKRSKTTTSDTKASDQIKIQGLGFKTLTQGMLVLGQVIDVTTRDIVLALPNNLTGFVPLTAISDIVNRRIQAILEDDSEDQKKENEDDIEEKEVDVNIKKLARPGQYFRAYVTSTITESSTRGSSKSKRRIELSINPAQANIGLKASDLEENSMIQASVKSVEDHGLIMEFGLDDISLTGFISKKALGQAWKIEEIQEGQVMLCCITGKPATGKVINLCTDPNRIGDVTKHILKEASTIDSFLPGVLTEVLVTEVSGGGITGKIMGSIDATSDVMQSGSGSNPTTFQKIKIGQRVPARILYTLPQSDTKKVGVSLHDHVKKYEEHSKYGKKKIQTLANSSILESAKVTQVVPGVGLFFELGMNLPPGFAHISRLSENKVDALFEKTGPFAIDTVHKARVLSFNPIDGLYNLSLEKSILEKKYLRLEDVQVGSIVEGKVEKIILGAKGVTGILVNLEDGITGLVPEMHLADVKLQNPEKRFRENFPVKARVLSVDPGRRQIRLTLKKTIVNTDAAVWKDLQVVKEGDKSPGTIVKVEQKGAVIQFYGSIRGWLPVAEMSEAFIADATQHFRVGQTIMVHAKRVDAENNRLVVSCRDAIDTQDSSAGILDHVKIGTITQGRVTEIAQDSVTFELKVDDIPITGIMNATHLTDGSVEKGLKMLQSLRVGQKLSEILILGRLQKTQAVVLSNKPSLIESAKNKTLLMSFDDVKESAQVAGFVRNITPDGIFVEFGDATVGYLPKTQVTREMTAAPAFGYRKDMSISCRVLTFDPGQKRFLLTMREDKSNTAKVEPEPKALESTAKIPIVNAVDGVSTFVSDYSLGKATKARIISVKETQLNVQLADNIQGRVDVSEVFDKWTDIPNHKKPLAQFKVKDVLDVKILGIHDARNHRFLPISHRQARVPVFELTAKIGNDINVENDHLNLAKIEVGSEHIAFVNNISEGCVWVNITPNVRGRVDLMDLSEHVSLVQAVGKNFPIGSALRVRVASKDIENGRLDLVAAGVSHSSPQNISDLSIGAAYKGKVVRVTERNVLVALSDAVSGVIDLTSISDDYSEASTAKYAKNDMLRVAVVNIDVPNKRVFLSTRPSKILSSSHPIVDKEITTIKELSTNDIVRGFVKLVRNNGLIISLGARVEAFVRISDLSDAFIKDWQSEYSIDQLVKGKILEVDVALNHVSMSLKASHVDNNYTPPKKLEDFAAGDIVTGKVRKVEDFGVFIDVDNSQPRVSGLCHRSQIADQKVLDIKSLYDQGDKVKAKVLSVDLEKRRISFGLKASYFADDVAMSENDIDSDEDKAQESADEEMMDVDGGIDISNNDNGLSKPSENDLSDSESESENNISSKSTGGLKTSGFNWNGDVVDEGAHSNKSRAAIKSTNPVSQTTKSKSDIVPFTDQTGTLDADGPQSAADFERLLLTTPYDSDLWTRYMAFYLRLSEISTARDIGHRALSTIPVTETDQKLNMWIALLNLEVSYPSPTTSSLQEDSITSLLRQACSVADAYKLHLHLAEIYTSTSQIEKAESIYESMLSSSSSVNPIINAKQAKAFRAIPSLWLSYAEFLLSTAHNAEKARGLLSRALQSIDEREKRGLTIDFAKLEFKACVGVGRGNRRRKAKGAGDAERGRTILEGVVETWPRWSQGWDEWLSCEIGLLRDLSQQEVVEEVDGWKKKGKKESGGEKEKEKEKEVLDQKIRVEKLFERITSGKMKSRRAKNVFKKWNEFEEKYGNDKDKERVVALAKEWVNKAKNEVDGDDNGDEE